MSGGSRRASISLVEAEILSQQAFAGDQYILRVHAPACARRAEPGSFAHLTCDSTLPMRRPLSIMRASDTEGWLEFLYKPVGAGLAKLAERTPGETVSVLAPIGNGFALRAERPKVLAIGGGVGIPPMIFLAERIKHDPRFDALVLMGSEVPFPFELCRSALDVSGVPAEASDGVALLERWGIASRLSSRAPFDGCYAGFVTELAREWLAGNPAGALAAIQLLACGPGAMLRAAAQLARDFALPCQLALEEYMACGVGGCAGCTVLVHGASGAAMKRVCVDGPVFEAAEVFPG